MSVDNQKDERVYRNISVRSVGNVRDPDGRGGGATEGESNERCILVEGTNMGFW